ncbi:MAG: mercuric reductase [Gemmatimonadota bacterium]
MTYDLIVIGAGQGGGPLAGAFARAGRKVALIERAYVGGTCVNVGCTPTKTMVASARIAYLAHRAHEYGVSAGSVSVDMAHIRSRKQRIVQSFRSGSAGGLERAGVEVIYGTARLVGRNAVAVEKAKGVFVRLSAKTIVIDTGTRPFVPPITGLDRTPFLDSTSIMELGELPSHLVVLGGGPIGLEFAQMFRRFGSRITVLQRGSQLLSQEDPEVGAEVAKILSQDGIDVVLGAEAAEVSSGEGERERITITYRDSSGRRLSVTSSHLLVAVGRVPNTEELTLGAAGVAVDDRGFVRVNERLETTARGIYALGDVTGEPQFTHVSYDDFRILRANLLEDGRMTTAGRVIPYTVYIDPQLGRIGMTERQARLAGYDVQVATLPMASVARAIEVDETRGFMKAVVENQSQRILGATVLGIEGGEMASLIQVAMLGNLPYTALRDAMFAHPTLAESMNNLFRRLAQEPTPARQSATSM